MAREQLETFGWRVLDAATESINGQIEIVCAGQHSKKTSLFRASSRKPRCDECAIEEQPTIVAGRPSQKFRQQLGEHNLEFVKYDETTDVVSVRCLDCRTVKANLETQHAKDRITCLCKTSSPRQSPGRVLINAAARKGGQLLSQEIFGLRALYKFRCAEGHTWEASGQSVAGPHWCPQCASNFPRSLEELKQIVADRGGKLITDEYRGVDGSYAFECSLGHTFSNRFKKVENGQWCPTCSRSTKSEEIARVCMEDIFDAPFPKKRPKWLRNSRGRQMELDGYSEELGLAFEYQGIQHFEADWRAVSGDLQQRVGDDLRKKELCEQHLVDLFFLTYRDSYEDFASLTIDQAERFGPRVAELVRAKNFDINRAYIREDRIDELRDLLKAKKIMVHDPKWISSDYMYSLECLTCRHRWKARGNAFFNTRRVAGCNQCARAANGRHQRGSLEDLRRFAAKFGGQVLSTEYTDARGKYEFVCAKGHKFSGLLNNMTHRNQFCPVCEKRIARRKKGGKEEPDRKVTIC